MTLLLASCFLFMGVPSLLADVRSFFDQSVWLEAINDSNELTVFSFQGDTETNGISADDPGIQPSYASQGVVFLPFIGSTNYPIITRNQQYQISAPGHDGLLVNSSSTNTTSDLEGRAIRFSFIIPAKAVGLNFNGPRNGGDYGYLKAYDFSGNLIGQTPECSAGGFVGLVADTEISRVHVINTGDDDISCGIWDLQFKETPPTLRIHSFDPVAKIFWPATAQNYILECTDQLLFPNWQTVTTTSVVVGNEWCAPAEINIYRQYYRLHRK